MDQVLQRVVVAGKLPEDLPSRAWPCLDCEATGLYERREYSGTCSYCQGSGFRSSKVLNFASWYDLHQPLDMPVKLGRETLVHLDSQPYKRAVESGREICYVLLKHWIEQLVNELDAMCLLYYVVLPDQYGCHLYTYNGFDFPLTVSEDRTLWDLNINAGVIAVFTRSLSPGCEERSSTSVGAGYPCGIL